jgi:hypothetical protein
MIHGGLTFGRTSLLFGRDIMIRAVGMVPARSLPVRGSHIKSVGNEHCLFDERGNLLGTIAAARVPPIFASNAPTFFLRVKPHITCREERGSEHR